MPKKEIEFPEIVALRLDAETRKKLEAMAKAELRSIGAMGRIVLMEGIAARAAKKGRKKVT
jgi:hypothetical protein